VIKNSNSLISRFTKKLGLQKMTTQWFGYHLKTFPELIWVFNPFKTIGKSIPGFFIPHGRVMIFLFSLFSTCMIYIPVFSLLIVFIVKKVLIPELFIVSIFGFAFGTIFRSVQAEDTSVVFVDRSELKIIIYGFFAKKIYPFRINKLVGIILYKNKYRSTKNYKICVQLDDGRQVLLKLTIFHKKAIRYLNNYHELLGLSVIEPPKRRIINDNRISLDNR